MPGHPRSKTDEAIQKMAAKGGVMGICFVRNFIRDKEPTTVEHVVDHFDYVRKLVGVEYLGVGSDLDLDPRSWTPETIKELTTGHPDAAKYKFRDKPIVDGLDHPKRTYDLAEGLIKRGYNDTDIKAILGGNFKRVLSEIWSA
jgi:membrane dipeptidase